MELHGNARLCPFQRQLMCARVRQQGWKVITAASAAGCSERTCHNGWPATTLANQCRSVETDRPEPALQAPTQTGIAAAIPANSSTSTSRSSAVSANPAIASPAAVPATTTIGLVGKPGPPLVERLGREPQQPARCRHPHALSCELLDERVHHFGEMSFAKNAAARRRIRFSSSRTRFRFLTWRSSSASASVRPGRTPSSMSACLTRL